MDKLTDISNCRCCNNCKHFLTDFSYLHREDQGRGLCSCKTRNNLYAVFENCWKQDCEHFWYSIHNNFGFNFIEELEDYRDRSEIISSLKKKKTYRPF